MKLPPALALIRPFQWYKNLLVFLALVFVGDLFNPAHFIRTILGFISLCAVSSSYYIINDLVDIEADRAHPEKRSRPLASGRISKGLACIMSASLLLLSLALAYTLSLPFLAIVAVLFLGALLYSFALKQEPLIDVLTIGTFFVLRAISGPLILHISISPWLIICTFFMALFVALTKRRGDLVLGKKSAQSQRKVYSFYTLDILDHLILVFVAVLILSYAFYCFLTEHAALLITLPIAVYGLLRYYILARGHPEFARHPHFMFKDTKTVAALILWALLVLFIIYDARALHVLRWG